MPFGTFPVCRGNFGSLYTYVWHCRTLCFIPGTCWILAVCPQCSTNRSMGFRIFRIYAFFKREQRHSFIWTRESRTSTIFPRASGNFLICSSEFKSFSIFPRRGRTLPLFPGESGRFYLYTWQSKDIQFFNREFGNFPM